MTRFTRTSASVGSPSSAQGSSSMSRSFGRWMEKVVGSRPGFLTSTRTIWGGEPRGSGTKRSGNRVSADRSGELSRLKLTSSRVSGVRSAAFSDATEKWAHMFGVEQPRRMPSTRMSRMTTVGNDALPLTTQVSGSTALFFFRRLRVAAPAGASSSSPSPSAAALARRPASDSSATRSFAKGSAPRTSAVSRASSPRASRAASAGSMATWLPCSSTAWTLQTHANSKSPAASGWNVTLTRCRLRAGSTPQGWSMSTRSVRPSEGAGSNVRSASDVSTGSSPCANARSRAQ
mmetsp:Transcript_28179/g.96010  ORF Transcript_28179/g.96010 Transcript_28179/m.96010 type:complete len:290 (+) Transcript_28179:818-1687(+)